MFVSTNTCDGKGECIKQCPTKAIRLINGKALSCLTCGLCYKNCPSNAIFINSYGGYVVDRAKCSGCGMCMYNCPIDNIKIEDGIVYGICSRCGVCEEACPSNSRIDSFRLNGAEALVRWKHDGKLISPGEFIPVFERNGMICQLDFYMLENVCIAIRDWLARGIEPVRVSVNFSRKHLTNPHLADDIMSVLNRYETESRYIEIELTETVDQNEAGLLAAFMGRMKNYHVTMSIDDFGTGYSSLNMLRTFPVDVLKIDRSFILDLEQNSKTVLSNIIRMADELHMDVVAEGVETYEQMNYLKSIDCKEVQGFLFDRPMPIENFEQKLISKQYVVE